MITVAQSYISKSRLFYLSVVALFLCTWYFQINDNLLNWQCFELILSRFTFLSTGSFLKVNFTEKCHPQTVLNDLRNTTIFVGVLFCGSKSYSKLSERVPNFSTTHNQKTPHYDNIALPSRQVSMLGPGVWKWVEFPEDYFLEPE